MKLYVANVGVNSASASKRGLKSPVFPDGSFEFVPIKESSAYAVGGIPTYKDIPAVSGRARFLAAYVPEKMARYVVHNDPEFVTFTYGDILTPRASNLRKIEPGDELWFLARLWDHDGKRWLGSSDFYFIGRFSVERNVRIKEDTDADDLDPDLRDRIHNNAHYRRFTLPNARNPFRVIIGNSEKSVRFRKALKVTPEVAALLFAASYNAENDTFLRDGKVVTNRSNTRPRTFSKFGSTTRAIQAFLDSNDPVDAPYIAELRLLEKDME